MDGSAPECSQVATAGSAQHCFKWLKFHFCEPENSCLFAEFIVPIGWIIF